MLGSSPLARKSAADDGWGLPVDAALTGLFEPPPDAVAIPPHNGAPIQFRPVRLNRPTDQ